MSKKTTLFNKAFNCTEYAIKQAKKPFIKKKLERAFDAAISEAQESIMERDSLMLSAVKEMVSNSDTINVSRLQNILEDKRAAEQAEKDFNELKTLVFDTEVDEEEVEQND